MQRRQFIKGSILTAASVGLVGGVWVSIPSNTRELSIDAAINQIDQLAKGAVFSSGEWLPGKVFAHCAQSIEFSMSGFPEHKSDLFKNTAGRLAFSIFSSKGKMKHGLSEDIPGASDLESDQDTLMALERLKKTFLVFEQYTKKLEPHFAYGTLSKKDYELAHVMHFYNHLDEIMIKT